MNVTGRVIEGRYRVVRRIGEGGMGVVYEAEHTGLGKRVAVKLLHPQYAENPEVLERFKREARAACRIGHLNIVDVVDIGATESGAPYMVMELLSGESLAAMLKREQRLPLERSVHILGQVLSALAAAHGIGIVHRDVKPENVFITMGMEGRDFVKILDFGISKFLAGSLAGAELTQTGSMLGTPLYLAPEQARGDKDIDHRADLYAVAVMAYQMLSGRVPFSGDNIQQLLFRIATEQPAPLAQLAPDLPQSVVRVIETAIAKDRELRPPDAAAFRWALAAAAGQQMRFSDPIERRSPAATPNVVAGARDVVRLEQRGAAEPIGKLLGAIAPEAHAEGSLQPDPTVTPSIWSGTVFRRRRLIPVASVLVIAALAVAAVVTWVFRGEGTEPESVVAPLQAAKPTAAAVARPVSAAGQPSPPIPKPPEPAEVPEPPVAPPEPAAALPETVRVELIALPEGAELLVNGQAHAERPLVLPRSSESMTLTASAPGHHTTVRKLTPDRDQSIRLPLHRKKKASQPAVTIPASSEKKPDSKKKPAAEKKPVAEKKPPKEKPSYITGKDGTKIKVDYDDE